MFSIICDNLNFKGLGCDRFIQHDKINGVEFDLLWIRLCDNKSYNKKGEINLSLASQLSHF